MTCHVCIYLCRGMCVFVSCALLGVSWHVCVCVVCPTRCVMACVYLFRAGY